MSRNQVKGPTSALTSFLREKGIHVPRSTNRFSRNINNQEETQSTEDLENQQSTTTSLSTTLPSFSINNTNHNETFEIDRIERELMVPIPTPPRRGSRRSNRRNLEETDSTVNTRLSDPNSQDPNIIQQSRLSSTILLESTYQLHSDNEDPQFINNKSSSSPSNNTHNLASAEKVSIKKKAKKKLSDDDYEDDDGEFAPSKVAPRHNYSKRRKLIDPSNDSNSPLDKYIRICANCQRRFIVDQLKSDICQACTNFPSSSARSRSKKLKNKSLKSDQDEFGVKSLKSLCIKLIAEYIEDVEQFGDISTAMKIKISQIISRYRQLNNHTMKLFLHGAEDQVELFDCSKLNEDSLKMIGMICPNLTKLNLSYCGQMNDAVIRSYAGQFTRLKSLKLGGCFLVSDHAFQTLFESIGDTLEELTLQEASKFSFNSLSVLAKKGKLLTLKLKRCDAIDEPCIQLLKSFKKLVTLKLIELNPKLTCEPLIGLFKDIGPQLNDLTLSGFENITDQVLLEGVLPFCLNLTRLSLKLCTSLSSEAVAKLFTHIKSPGFRKLNLSGLVCLQDDALKAVLDSCKTSIRSLDLNGCDEMTESFFHMNVFQSTQTTGPHVNHLIQHKFPYLENLNISWIRMVDDEILKKLIDACPCLKTIFVYGCNRLTPFALNQDWKNFKGERIRFYGNEFD